jgi:hypothetical protein
LTSRRDQWSADSGPFESHRGTLRSCESGKGSFILSRGHHQRANNREESEPDRWAKKNGYLPLVSPFEVIFSCSDKSSIPSLSQLCFCGSRSDCSRQDMHGVGVEALTLQLPVRLLRGRTFSVQYSVSAISSGLNVVVDQLTAAVC